MHEASIAKNIIEIIETYSDRLQGRVLKSVTIRIGELSGVFPDSLNFYYTEMVKGTLAEGSTLNFEECPFKAQCRICATEFDINNFELNCPNCNNHENDIIGGYEFEIVSMEIE